MGNQEYPAPSTSFSLNNVQHYCYKMLLNLSSTKYFKPHTHLCFNPRRMLKTKDEEIEEMVKELADMRAKTLKDTGRSRGLEDSEPMEKLMKSLEGSDRHLQLLANFALQGTQRPLIGTEEKANRNKIEGKTIEQLIQDLKAEDAGVRSHAIKTLGDMGGPAVEPLLHALKGGDWMTRAAATLALGIIGEPAVDPLLDALKSDDWDTRRRAARALGWIGNRKAVPALMEALKDKDPFVQLEAADALATIGDPASKGSFPITNFFNSKRLKNRRG